MKTTLNKSSVLLPKRVLATILALTLASPILASNTQSPTLKLFSKNIISQVKETGQMANSMDQSLRQPIMEMQKQMELFTSTGCDNNDSDPGCEQINKQIAQSYKTMLSTLSEQLPRIKRMVVKTNRSLKAKILQNIGKRMTPAELQDNIGSVKKPDINRPGMSMLQRISHYADLVSFKSNTNIMDLASDIYMDTAYVEQTIEVMQAQIQQQQLILEITTDYAGGITPEMKEVVGGVKTMLFGTQDSTETGELSNPAELSTQQENDLLYRY